MLLDHMQLDAPESPESSDMQEIHSLGVYHSSDTQISNSDMKIIIMKLSEKEPRLLLSVLKLVIEMIEAKEELTNKGTLKCIIMLPAEISLVFPMSCLTTLICCLDLMLVLHSVL